MLCLITDELHKVQSMLKERSMMNAELNEKLQRQTAELDGIKTAAAVAESVKLDEIDSERRKCAEELATLQQLMKGAFCFALCIVLSCKLLV